MVSFVRNLKKTEGAMVIHEKEMGNLAGEGYY